MFPPYEGERFCATICCCGGGKGLVNTLSWEVPFKNLVNSS